MIISDILTPIMEHLELTGFIIFLFFSLIAIYLKNSLERKIVLFTFIILAAVLVYAEIHDSFGTKISKKENNTSENNISQSTITDTPNDLQEIKINMASTVGNKYNKTGNFTRSVTLGKNDDLNISKLIPVEEIQKNKSSIEINIGSSVGNEYNETGNISDTFGNYRVEKI